MPLPTEVVVHPLVLLSAVDHYSRVAKDTRKRVVGVLLGSTFKGKCDVTNSFAVPFEEDLRNPTVWYLDHSFLEKMELKPAMKRLLAAATTAQMESSSETEKLEDSLRILRLRSVHAQQARSPARHPLPPVTAPPARAARASSLALATATRGTRSLARGGATTRRAARSSTATSRAT